MANGFGSMALTTKGKNLLAKAQTGTVLTFTRVVIGSGTIGNTDVAALNSLIAQEMSLSISDYINNGSTATICTVLSNSALTTGFYWKEIGLFATDPTLGEILYGYASAGDGEIFIPASSTSSFESACNVTISISNVSSVTATIGSLIYATEQSITDIKDGTTKVAKATVADTATNAATAANYTTDGTIATGFAAQSTAVSALAGTSRTTETVKGNADAIASLSTSVTSNDALRQDIKGTIQYPTITNGQITEIDHKSGTTVIRSDVFTYTADPVTKAIILITEVRTIVATGATVTLKYHLDTLETEVI